MPVWDDLLSRNDQAVFDAYRPVRTLGERPAVLVVDVTYGYVGLKPEPILESIKSFPLSCGERGWHAIEHIRDVLAVAREHGIPVIHGTGDVTTVRRNSWGTRDRRGRPAVLSAEELAERELENRFVDEIAPIAGELVIKRRAASMFSGTPLVTWLHDLELDTLIVTGTTTSGCLRATVVDAACESFNVAVVEECSFDRLDISHRVSLLDMQMKYASVVSVDVALDYLRGASSASSGALAAAPLAEQRA